jgi:hypothetical protein
MKIVTAEIAEKAERELILIYYFSAISVRSVVE